MEVKITLMPEEVKTAIKAYINTQGMGVVVKEVSIVNGEAVALCERVRTSTGSLNYLDR